MINEFILKCNKCGKEIEINNAKGHCDKNGLSIFVTDYETIEISCICGNEIEL